MRLGAMRTLVLPGVLRPPSDTELLLAVMHRLDAARGAKVLDVFTGSGVLAVAAAMSGARETTAVDISRRAVLNTRINAALNGVRVRARRGDVFAPVGGLCFDLIVANPPYIPALAEDLPRRGPARAWDAGLEGRALLDRLCDGLAERLRPAGEALIVQSSLPGERQTLARLERAGLEATVEERRPGPLGPIVEARAPALERRGILAPGQREEELLVIRAARVARS